MLVTWYNSRRFLGILLLLESQVLQAANKMLKAHEVNYVYILMKEDVANDSKYIQ